VIVRDDIVQAPSVAVVHESALRVLERTGVVVQDDEAVALLRARGVRCDGRRVHPTEEQVRRALQTAPSAFVLAGRRPELALPLGGPDGRVFGKMAHSERTGEGLLKNIPGDKEQHIFRAGVDYFR